MEINEDARNASVIVVGAGQAGFAVVNRLRELGHTGPLTLIGDEPHPPYQRPPLSKAYLLGQMARERMQFRPPEFYAERGIDLRLNTAAVAIHRGAQRLELSDGTALRYDHLVLATGASPRRLPADIGGDLGGVLTVRSLADADAMIAALQPGRRLLVVGGGYIGLEAAASTVKLGLHVTLIEAAPRILQRVAAVETAAHLRELHLSHGVDLREGVGLIRLIGDAGHVCRAELSDGTVPEVDLVIAGIGVTPCTDLAERAGLALENGIRTDAFCRTSDPIIFAAGDCSSFPHEAAQIRLESVGNAIDQAGVVAANILGQNIRYNPKPWFWSDQYDAKLQIAGLSSGYDRVESRDGAGKSFWYFAANRLLAVDAINDPKIYMMAKRLIEAGIPVSPEAVQGSEAGLRALLSALMEGKP